MNIHIRFDNPTQADCEVTVFINGENAGKLRLKQDEVVGFQQIIEHGCVAGLDRFLSSGTPNPAKP